MSYASSSDVDLHVVGHPFAQIGMGTHVRSVFRALRAAQLQPQLLDVYGGEQSNVAVAPDLVAHQVTSLARGINIFCINGDEVRPILNHLGAFEEHGSTAYNIAYPMWELPHYPKPWAVELEWFDEVWAPSRFVESALRPQLGEKVHHLPIACEVRSRAQRTRRYFNIPDSAFVFLTVFDFLSYLERKNPYAVIEAFRRVEEMLPQREIVLVMKTQNSNQKPTQYREFIKAVSELGASVVVIDATLPADDTLALISLCDAFVSLHRSEGFGLGISEAMCLGRPTVCTAWSGNMDFCTPESNQLIDYQLRPVEPGSYPYWQDQVWAEADVDHAAEKMAELADDFETYTRISFEGRVRMARDFSLLATGLRYDARLRRIVAENRSLQNGRLDEEDAAQKPGRQTALGSV